VEVRLLLVCSMTRIKSLIAELWAIELWDRLYKQSTAKTALDDSSYRARQMRKREIQLEAESCDAGEVKDLNELPFANRIADVKKVLRDPIPRARGTRK